jgi:hypothetical protein
MMNPSRSILLACALCAATVVAHNELRAGDLTIPPAPVKAAIAPAGYKGPVEYEGKVMVVNRREQTVTVEIAGKLHLFKMNPKVQISRKGKPVSMQEILTGQWISVVARSLDDGTLQLVSVGVDPGEQRAQPAGGGTSANTSKASGERGSGAVVGKPGTGPARQAPPFQGGNLPGHVEKVVVSPNN